MPIQFGSYLGTSSIPTLKENQEKDLGIIVERRLSVDGERARTLCARDAVCMTTCFACLWQKKPYLHGNIEERRPKAMYNAHCTLR